MNDEEITELIFSRSQQGITEIAAKYGRLLMSVAEGILSDRTDSEECVNDTYLKTWNTIPPYRPQYLRAFLCRLTRQISLDRYRENHRQKRGSVMSIMLSELDEDITDGSTVEGRLNERELSEDISEFLDAQDAETRVLFVRRYYMAQSVRSLAQLTGMTENSVSVKLHRTRKKLKRYLIGKGYFL